MNVKRDPKTGRFVSAKSTPKAIRGRDPKTGRFISLKA